MTIFPLPEAPTTATTSPGREPCGELFDEVLSTEEQVAVRGLEGGQTRIWRHRGVGRNAEAVGVDGQKGFGLVEPGEPVRSEGDEADVGGQVARRQAGRGRRDEHLSGVGQRADAGHSTESGSGVAAVGGDGLAGVRRAVDLDATAGQLALEVDPGTDGVAGAMEHRHRGVALDSVPDASPAVAFDGPIDHEQVLGQQARRGVGQVLPQPGR